MGFILKYCLNNIFSAKLRTAIIVLCITAASFVLSVCLLISYSSDRIVESQLRTEMGSTDIVFTSDRGMPEIESADCDVLPVNIGSMELQRHDIKNYKYVESRTVRILGLDTARSADLGLLSPMTAPESGEVVITYPVSRLFGYKKGGVLPVHTASGDELQLTVRDVVYCERMLSVMTMSIIVTPETAELISGGGANAYYIDVLNDKSIAGVADELREKYPAASVQQLMGSSEIAGAIAGTASMFWLILIMVLLMTVFILHGFSKNIAAERISTIGTFRSIGAEKSRAAFILFAENVLYGVMGGVLGSVIFFAVKDSFVSSFIMSASGSFDVPLWLPAAVVTAAAAIPLACSAASIISAAKMPLRDIIFGKSDTAYEPSKAMAAGGAVLIAASILLRISDSFAAGALALAAMITGVCLVIPTVTTFISSKLHFTSGKFPIARFALMRLGTKKQLAAQTVMLTAASMITLSVLVITSSVNELYSAEIYDCDVIVQGLSERSESYSDAIRNASAADCEFVYSKEDELVINGTIVSATIIGGEYRMMKGIRDMAKSPAEGEIVLDRVLMKRLGIAAGDRITVSFLSGTVRPVEQELEVAGSCDSSGIDIRCSGAVISMELYRKIYKDQPSMLLLRTDAETIYLADSSAEVITAEEYRQSRREERSSILGITTAIMVLGVLLELISSCGNLSVSLIQQRHEFAVLYSSGVSRSMLIKLIVTENLYSVLVSAAVSLGVCPFASSTISGILSAAEINIPLSANAVLMGAVTAAVVLLIVLTAFLQALTLRKMEPAQQLKYE